MPNGSTYGLKDAGLRNLSGVLSGDGSDVAGVDELYFRPTVKIFDGAPERTDLSVVKLSGDDYLDLVEGGDVLSGALYVVESDYEDAYGQQIKNVAAGSDLSDAVNYGQLAQVSARAFGTYTSAEVDQKIASAQFFKKYVVESLPPVAEADERGIYLVPSQDPETQNTYEEYVVVVEGSSKAWEKIGAKNIDLSGYKTRQDALSSPAADGSALAFIDTITQDANGVITATKKSVQAASTVYAGVVQLNNTLTSDSIVQAATANAVRLVNDKAEQKSSVTFVDWED